MPTVVTALRDHLIASGVGRLPETPGALPPIYRDMQTGAPNPVDLGIDAVIELTRTGGVPPRPFEGERRQPIVQVNLRVRKAPMAETIGEKIEQAILDRRNWLMGLPGGQLRVIESEQVAPLSLTQRDEQGYDYRTSFAFELYRDATVAVP